MSKSPKKRRVVSSRRQSPSLDVAALAREAQRRASSLSKVDFGKLAFPRQLDFITDRSPRVVACCGRRGGKTRGLSFKLLRSGLIYPHSQVFYITLAMPQARRNVWPMLQEIDRELNLGCKFSEGKLSCTLPNGSIIWLGGAGDEAEIQRYRGIGSPLFVIDEAQAFKWYLHSLVEEICEPALADFGGEGQIVMTGTPNATSHGYFYEAATGKSEVPWSRHHWTLLENIHLPNREKFFNEQAAKYRLGQKDPRFQREYLGQWIRDVENCVFNLTDDNLVHRMPEGIEDWRYVLGMDVGYVDATAFVVLGYSPSANVVVAIESFEESKLDLIRAGAKVVELDSKYNFESIVIDPGGGGKFHIEHIKQRLRLPAKAAQKAQKISAIEFLNTDLRNRSLSIVKRKNTDLINQMFVLRYNFDRVKDRHGGLHPTARIAIDDHDPDHLSDALLYAHRECSHWLAQYTKEPPTPHTQQWYDEEEARLRKQAMDAAKQEVEAREELESYGWY